MEAMPAAGKFIFDANAERVPAPAVDRTDMETGPAKQSKRLSRVLVSLAVQYLFTTKADYLAFIAWFNDDISRGADWFTWTDPLDGAPKRARIVGGAIRSKPTNKSHERWIVSFTLEWWE